MVADGERRIVEAVVIGEGERADHAVRRLPPEAARVRRPTTRRSISAAPTACGAPSRWASCCRWRSAPTICESHDDGGRRNASTVIRARAPGFAPRAGDRARLRARRLSPTQVEVVADDPLCRPARLSGARRRRPCRHSSCSAASAATPVALLPGRAHYYEHGRADVMKVPVRTLARLGCDDAGPDQCGRQPARAKWRPAA